MGGGVERNDGKVGRNDGCEAIDGGSDESNDGYGIVGTGGRGGGGDVVD